MMNVRLAEGNGNRYAGYNHSPIGSHVESGTPDIGTLDFCAELMRHS